MAATLLPVASPLRNHNKYQAFSLPYRFCQLFQLSILTGKKAPSDKTTALTKSRNMGIKVAGTSRQLFIRGS